MENSKNSESQGFGIVIVTHMGIGSIPNFWESLCVRHQ